MDHHRQQLLTIGPLQLGLMNERLLDTWMPMEVCHVPAVRTEYGNHMLALVDPGKVSATTDK